MNKIEKMGDVYNIPIKFYECDAVADLATIPENELFFGCQAHIIEKDTNYRYDGSDWKIQN